MATITNLIKKAVQSLQHLFFPRCCIVCGTALREGEEMLCLRCNMDMPRTNYHLQKDNPVEKLFWGKIPLERATGYFFYQKGSRFGHVLHKLKYSGRCDIGEAMGRFMAAELQTGSFFDGIDVIIPIPLHPKKQHRRGYNQSEWLARGISRISGLPMEADAVIRIKDTETQTHKSAYERWTNVNGIFRVKQPERFTGKHILLVDDVLTTGATTTACADAFGGIEGISISILSLAVAAQ